MIFITYTYYLELIKPTWYFSYSLGTVNIVNKAKEEMQNYIYSRISAL